MDFSELAQSRFSVRTYTDRAVEDEKLQKILEAARMAPTAKNLQPFRIVVMRTKEHEDALKKMYRGAFLTQAPLVHGVYACPQAGWVRFDGKNYADVDAAIVMDHIIMAATDLGLGTCWIGAFGAEAARELAGLGDGFEPVAFTPLGYSAAERPPKTRKPLADIVTYL